MITDFQTIHHPIHSPRSVPGSDRISRLSSITMPGFFSEASIFLDYLGAYIIRRLNFTSVVVLVEHADSMTFKVHLILNNSFDNPYNSLAAPKFYLGSVSHYPLITNPRDKVFVRTNSLSFSFSKRTGQSDSAVEGRRKERSMAKDFSTRKYSVFQCWFVGEGSK